MENSPSISVNHLLHFLIPSTFFFSLRLFNYCILCLPAPILLLALNLPFMILHKRQHLLKICPNQFLFLEMNHKTLQDIQIIHMYINRMQPIIKKKQMPSKYLLKCLIISQKLSIPIIKN